MTIEVISENALLSDAVAAIEKGRKSIAVIVSPAGKLVGTISDGDIRRAILQGLAIESSARAVATLNPVTAREGASAEHVAKLLAENGLEALPIIDSDGNFVRTASLEELTTIQGKTDSGVGYWAAVVMAGGEGKRLMPYTKDTPKPMLLVGGMPIIERNIRALARLGVKRVYIAINYLGHVIERHFRDGAALGVQIEYLRETEPLGTGGAIGLIPDRPLGPVLVMNGDLVTGLDIGKLLAFHEMHAAEITVAAKNYVVEVPFGVLQMDGVVVTGLVEKPSENFLCNAGIYVLAPAAFDHLPAGGFFNMTTLIENAFRNGRRVVAFPLFALWKDVGTLQQLEEARALVNLGTIVDV